MRFITFIFFIISAVIGNTSNSYVDKVPILNIANILLQESNEQSLRETCAYYNCLPSDQKVELKGIPSDNLLVFERNGSSEKIVIKPEIRDGRPVFQVFVHGLRNIGKTTQMLDALGYTKQSPSLYSSGMKRCEISGDFIKFYIAKYEAIQIPMH